MSLKIQRDIRPVGQLDKSFHFPGAALIFVVKHLAVHGQLEVRNFQNAQLPLCGGFGHRKAGQQGDPGRMFQHLDDKRGIADLKAGGQFDLMGSEKLIESAAVVCVALGQEERLVPSVQACLVRPERQIAGKRLLPTETVSAKIGVNLRHLDALVETTASK